MNMLRWFLFCCSIAPCLSCGSAPQGPKDRAKVSGKVTFNGQPLPAGTISFRSLETPVASSVVFEQGVYSTDRAPIGKCAVAISTRLIEASAPALYVAIPEKYADQATSGLTADVKPGENANVDFALNP